ncbi:endolytic transglycosylase MltG [Ferrimonas senticii]|uniref:endolytic transglycosylase MltG n=1 Tax=Ferrimonas senticii TaxID=394566 RepID=UPI0003F92F4E|nr:endolytic transglycosylase MltG [Ferrimonas senticii]
MRWLARILKLIGVAATIAIAAGVVAYQQVEKSLAAPLAHGNSAELVVKSGENVRTLLTRWQQQGWVESELWLRLALKLKPQLANIKVGTYQLPEQLTVEQALALLVKGVEAQFSITLVEGGTIKQWLAQIAEHPRLKHTIESPQALAQALKIDQSNPEGWFYPDTYSFNAGSSDLELLTRAHLKMEQELQRVWQDRQQPLPLNNAYELLTLASIIEKETAVASERPTVASVFINRLNKKMRLQTDPTVIYGVGDAYNGDITRKHLQTKTPYNTYRIDGLTPTPIANPSLASIEAAANPATSNYLYFVASGDGGHTFSKTLQEHNRAVKRYLALQKQ